MCKNRTTIIIAIGLVLTVLYFIFLNSIYNINIEKINKIKPEEMGDLISNFFGPIAFLWLIISNLLQGVGLNQTNKNNQKTQEISLKLIDIQEKEKKENLRIEHNLSQPIIDIEIFENPSFLSFHHKNIHQKNLFDNNAIPNIEPEYFCFEGEIIVTKNQVLNLEIPCASGIPKILEVGKKQKIDFYMKKSESKIILNGSYQLEVSFEDRRSEIQTTKLNVINDLGRLKLSFEPTLIGRSKDLH